MRKNAKIMLKVKHIKPNYICEIYNKKLNSALFLRFMSKGKMVFSSSTYNTGGGKY
jgi:hypothetical protein